MGFQRKPLCEKNTAELKGNNVAVKQSEFFSLFYWAPYLAFEQNNCVKPLRQLT